MTMMHEMKKGHALSPSGEATERGQNTHAQNESVCEVDAARICVSVGCVRPLVLRRSGSGRNRCRRSSTSRSSTSRSMHIRLRL